MDRAPLDNNTPRTTTTRGFWAANGRLVLALAAGALLTQAGGRILAPSTAQAQRSSRPALGIVNPADQRNEMIDELREISSRLSGLEKAFDGTLDVNVISMPAQQGNNGD